MQTCQVIGQHFVDHRQHLFARQAICVHRHNRTGALGGAARRKLHACRVGAAGDPNSQKVVKREALLSIDPVDDGTNQQR